MNINKIMDITLIIPHDLTVSRSVKDDLESVKAKYGIEYTIEHLEEEVCVQIQAIVVGRKNIGVVLYVHRAELVTSLIPLQCRDNIVLISENELACAKLPETLEVIEGRGEAVFKWAFRHLALVHHPRKRLYYGDCSDAFIDMWGANKIYGKPPALIILLHGGFWRHHYRLDMMAPVAADLVSQGYIVANCEYRRDKDWGFPQTTLCDVFDAISYIGKLHAEFDFDPDKIIVMGHSAGGYLALKSHRLLGASGAIVFPKLYISLSGVLDLEWASEKAVGDGAVSNLFNSNGGADLELSEFDHNEPHTGEIVFHGKEDATVPVAVSRNYVSSPQGAAVIKYVELSQAKHMTLTDPYSCAWQSISREISDWVQRATSNT